MDDPSGRSSPRRQLQGPRPPRLALSKDSHKIRKPPLAPQPQVQVRHQPAQAQQPRAPLIIYDASPKVIHTRPSEFMALVQRLTGPGQPQAAAQPEQFQPQGLLLSPAAAFSPAARLAAIEKSVRPMSQAPARYGDIADDAVDVLEGVLGPGRPGILSPVPSALPPVAFSGLFSPLPFDPSCISWLNDLSPIFSTTAAAGGGGSASDHGGGSRVGFDSFLPSPGYLLTTPTMPSPATFMEFFTNYPDL